MVGFYCGTQFHVFESIFLKKLYFSTEEAVLFIVSPLEIDNYETEAFFRLGFSDVIEINSQETACNENFDKVFFFSLFTHHPDYLKNLNKNKLVMAYDGITTFMLKHWESTDPNKTFSCNSDIDEFWVPTKELMLDEEYKGKCVEFDFKLDRFYEKDLFDLCEIMNEVFKYVYTPIGSKTVYMDRYLTKFSNVFFDPMIEKLLTQAIYYSYGQPMTFKRHPYDVYYKKKYAGLECAKVIESDAPWELIYLNSYVRQKDDLPNTYMVYNSFAPANLTLLFGDRNYKVICIQPILDSYSQLSKTYLNVDVTLRIFSRFSNQYQIELFVADSFADLKKRKNLFKQNYSDIVWNDIIIKAEKDSCLDTKSLLAFRLFLEGILEFKNESTMSYFVNRETSAGFAMEQVILSAIERIGYNLSRTDTLTEAELVIDFATDFAEYADDNYDIRNGSKIVVSVANVIDKEMLYKRIESKKNLYIWGATISNEETIELIIKQGQKDKLRCIFDGAVNGERDGIPIVKFDKSIIEKDSLIIICAKLAYAEIEKILVENGYERDIDYTYGIGIGI